MSTIDDVFSEYTRMRDNGLETKLALRSLRIYIDRMTRSEKEALADKLRQWERSRQPESSAPPSPVTEPPPLPDPEPAQKPRPSSVIKPLQRPAPEDTSGLWVECPNCETKNRTEDVFCYNCGHLLQPAADQFDTRSFTSATDDLHGKEYFGSDSVLLLEVRDSLARFELRPQLRRGAIVIGRSAEKVTLRPDVDLMDTGGAEQGVSRVHLSLDYDDKQNHIYATDLGSSNGSFINGQKLFPKERRLVQHGDSLRLGRLVLNISFVHPGEEMTE